MEAFDLTGRTALVTGGGRGIGRATAETLAQAGADVAVFARTRDQVDLAAETVEKEGRRSMALTGDAARSEDANRAVEHLVDQWGRIDILVNAAGVTIKKEYAPLPYQFPDHPLLTGAGRPMTDQEWQRVLDVNLTGAFYFCRAAAKHMIARRYGKIVNVSSTASIRPSPYSGPYAVSKSGLNMLTRSLAAEWAPAGITVNAISPGWFKTEMTANRFDHPELAARLTAGIPAGRAGDLRELGLAAVFLASAASDYITGQVLHVDGGLLLS